MTDTVLINAIVFFAAFAAATFSCGVVMRIARKANFVDLPNEIHKRQASYVALGGGIAIFVAAAAVSLFACVAGPELWKLEIDGSPVQMLSLFVACIVVVAVGYVDDRCGMQGVQKLAWQTVAACILVANGYCFRAFVFSGFRFDFGHFGALLSVLWILGAMNALNLIDGADGVAATLGVGISLSIGITAAISEGAPSSIVPLSLAGALVGFLLYNFPPAKMYLGDSGSMLVGLVASATAIQTSLKTQATFAIAAPIILLSIPIIDTSLAIFRRKLMGRSIYDTDRGHLHHCLLEQGWTPTQVVGIVACLTLFTSLSAIATIWAGIDSLSLFALVTVVGIGLRWGIMGNGEVDLIKSRLIEKFGSDKHCTDIVFVQIQGVRNWQPAWREIVDFATQKQIDSVEITANMPQLHEAFSGRYGNIQLLKSRSCWRFSAPLKVDGTKSGWIEFGGKSGRWSLHDDVQLFEFVRRLELVLTEIACTGHVLAKQGPNIVPPPFAIKAVAPNNFVAR